MTSRQLRNQGRAAERTSRKLEQKIAASSLPLIQSPEHNEDLEEAAAPAQSTRAEINRANSQHSSGPRTLQGKMKSSQNSFKHGLYSSQLVLPTEDPAELDQLRASIRADHQPANTTEEILVDEIAENFWRLRRVRELEGRTMQPENFTDLMSLLPMIQRTMASAERGDGSSQAHPNGFVLQNDPEPLAEAA
jgi:hypothetical protein